MYPSLLAPAKLMRAQRIGHRWPATVGLTLMIVAGFGCAGAPAPGSDDSATTPPPAAGATPWEQAGARGVEFRAIGQEPGWTLDLDQGRSIEYTGDYGKTKFSTPAPEPVIDTAARTVTYTARTEAHNLVVVIRDTTCSDVMSGERFSHSVTVRADGKELTGCGRPIPTGDITSTYWKLVELGGVAAVRSAIQREAHIRIVGDGRQVRGSTGCNSLSGPITVDSQTVRFGPLATTKVACADSALNRQERELLAALGEANRFMVADGHLTLFAGDRRLARFVAVYLR